MMVETTNQDSADVMSASDYSSQVSEMGTEIDNFTALLSRIEHNHGPAKGGTKTSGYSTHDLRGRFDISDEFVKSYLFSQTNDHLAVYEMGTRADELRGNEAQIFRDIDEDTAQSTIRRRWKKIKEFAGIPSGCSENAPTPPEAKKRLKAVIEIHHEQTDSEDTLSPVPERVQNAQSA